MKRLILLAALLMAVPAFAALPAETPFWSPDSRFIGFFAAGTLPAPTPEEAAAAAAKKAKADEAAKQAAELLTKAQDRAVQNYRQHQGTKGQSGNGGAKAPSP